MSERKYQKVAVIGLGNVGNAVAYGLVNQGLCNEVLLINRNKQKAIGIALDLRQSIEYMNRNMRVWAGDFDECGDADIAIFCVGGAAPKSCDRNDLLEGACSMVKPLVGKLMASGFSGHIIVVTNPVDSIAYYIWKLSGLPASHVIGTGTALDSARLKCFLSEISHVDPRSIMACSLGEHGNSQFIPWGAAFIAGTRIEDLVKRNPEMFDMPKGDFTYSEMSAHLLEKVKKAGWKIASLTGYTCYGVASAALAIARSILRDECSVIPCSVYLDGQYKLHDVFTSTPVAINANGVQDIFELSLSDEELEEFHESVSVIRSSIEKCREFL